MTLSSRISRKDPESYGVKSEISLQILYIGKPDNLSSHTFQGQPDFCSSYLPITCKPTVIWSGKDSTISSTNVACFCAMNVKEMAILPPAFRKKFSEAIFFFFDWLSCEMQRGFRLWRTVSFSRSSWKPCIDLSRFQHQDTQNLVLFSNNSQMYPSGQRSTRKQTRAQVSRTQDLAAASAVNQYCWQQPNSRWRRPGKNCFLEILFECAGPQHTRKITLFPVQDKGYALLNERIRFLAEIATEKRGQTHAKADLRFHCSGVQTASNATADLERTPVDRWVNLVRFRSGFYLPEGPIWKSCVQEEEKLNWDHFRFVYIWSC